MKTKDGNYELPKEQKYYLSINGKIDRKFYGSEDQCKAKAKSYENKGDKVTFVPVEEV